MNDVLEIFPWNNNFSIGINSHHKTFIANKNYFISKWGGEPLFETFTKPFNRD